MKWSNLVEITECWKKKERSFQPQSVNKKRIAFSKNKKKKMIGSFFSSQSKKHYEISVELSHL